jgi:large subunit ribosomal protein L6
VKFYVILAKNNLGENMSRIGKKAIDIPKDVNVTLKDEKIIVKGKHGSLEKTVLNLLQIELENNKLILKRAEDNKESRAYHGLMRALLQNMVTGVEKPYSKTLIAEGVGYKFQMEKTTLVLNVGFTHPVKFVIPADLTVKLESATKILISGIDKEKVGFFAAEIRAIRPPEPYKGKGIMYEGEKIIRKAGKTGK